jgi:hypothetical protein
MREALRADARCVLSPEAVHALPKSARLSKVQMAEEQRLMIYSYAGLTREDLVRCFVGSFFERPSASVGRAVHRGQERGKKSYFRATTSSLTKCLILPRRSKVSLLDVRLQIQTATAEQPACAWITARIWLYRQRN